MRNILNYLKNNQNVYWLKLIEIKINKLKLYRNKFWFVNMTKLH